LYYPNFQSVPRNLPATQITRWITDQPIRFYATTKPPLSSSLNMCPSLHKSGINIRLNLSDGRDTKLYRKNSAVIVTFSIRIHELKNISPIGQNFIYDWLVYNKSHVFFCSSEENSTVHSFVLRFQQLHNWFHL
jgi:hypothetical protein